MISTNFHGLVKGRIQGPAWFMAPLMHELSAYEGEESDDPDLVIELARLSRSEERGSSFEALAKEEARIEGKGGASQGGETLAWQGRHLIARWQVSMNGPGMRPRRVFFQGNLASRYIVSKWIVEPALRVVVEDRGALMVHAAALTDGERAVLVAGPGAAGKTTWALHWLGAGHPYLGDDFSLIKEGHVLSYITPLRLGARNLIANKVLKNMAVSDKALVILRTAMRRALFGYVKLYFKAPVQKAIPGVRIGEKAEPAAALWLDTDPRAAKKLAGARACSARDMAELMTGADLMEMHGFGGEHLDSLTSEERPPSPGFKERHQRRLVNLLADKPCFRLPAHCLPPKPALASVTELLAWLDQGTI